MNKLVFYILFILFATMFVKGIMDSNESFGDLNASSIKTLIEEKNERKFNELKDSEKKEAIDKGYFYSCREIKDYCSRNTVLGCAKFCGY